MAEQFDLGGKRALVTGGNGGIGLGIALDLARAGATVAIAGRDAARSEAALAQVREQAPLSRSFLCDLENTVGIEPFYAKASADMGGFDILVNNAGITYRGRADRIPIEEWDRVHKVNLTAPFVLSQCFARERIAAEKPGSVIMIASLMSEASRPSTAAYTSTKGAIRQLVRALAVDWAQHAIRVNGIGPGYVKTALSQPLVDDPEFDAWVKSRTPLGRWGEPADLGGAAVFLASDASAFVTGQILYVDGGWLATF